MKTKKLFKSLLMAMAMTVMIFGNTMTVFAATEGQDATIKEYIAQNGNTGIAGFTAYTDQNVMNNDCGAEYRFYTYTDGGGKVTYYAIKASDEVTAAAAIGKKNNAKGKTEHLNDNVLGGFAVEADTGTATGLLSGFMGPVSTFLGIVVVFVTIGMTVFTSLDLAYIAFPVFRGKCDDKKVSGGIGTKPGKDGNTKLTFITDDAQHAVIAADTVQSGKSPFTIYLKTRMLSFILLAIVIFILLTGNISIFATLALKLVQGILDFIQSFE